MSRIDGLLDLIGLGVKKMKPDPVTGTVSKLDEAILNMRQNKMQANQIENALMGMNAGVKRAEIQDTGLDRWLAQQQGSVTQEDIARYLDQQREPISVETYKNTSLEPLESFPEPAVMFDQGTMNLGTTGVVRDISAPDWPNSAKRVEQYRDWMLGSGVPEEEANQLFDLIKSIHAQDKRLPQSAWDKTAGTPYDINKFAEAAAYHEGAFENPVIGSRYIDPESSIQYDVTKTPRGYVTTEILPNRGRSELGGWSGETPQTLEEALGQINLSRTMGVDKTKYSGLVDPGMDMGTYREDVFTLPYRDAEDTASGYYHEQHWPDIDNPLVHLRSSHRELDDGGFSVHIEELQSDWHQQARQAGGYGGYATTKKLMNDAIDTSEEANRAITDIIPGRGTIESDDVAMVGGGGGHDARIFYTNDFGDQYRLAELRIGDDGEREFHVFDKNVKKAFPDGAPDNLEDLLENAADKQLGVRKIREAPESPADAPLKDDEWAWFGVKQAIKRAIDEGANGITLPNSKDMIFKENAMGHKKTENSLRKMYDEKLPSILKKIGKQYGVKPETRTIYYGDEANERTFLPLTDEMIEKIMNEGMKKYGKQDAPKGILDSLGDMYV